MRFWLAEKKKDTFDYTIVRECKNCHQSFQGRFCNRCGEKVVEPNERTIKYILNHIINAFTFLDGKLWRSLSAIILHPGRMAKDVSEGKRTPYMRPVSLFFVGNLIYFLFPIFETFNTNLYSQMDYMAYSKPLSIRSTVERKLMVEHIPLEQLAEDYKVISTNLSKTCLILWVGILSVLCFAVNYSRKKLFFDHVNFALEFANYALIVITVILGLLFYLIFEVTGFNLMRDSVLVYFYVPLLFYFLIRAIKLFYGGNHWVVAGKSLLTLFALIVSIELYRLFLFTATFYKL